MRRLQVGIVGAGIGGLALAALLGKIGAQVQLFERFGEPQPVGSGMVVQPVGMAVLDAIGVGPAARDLGQAILRMQGRTARKMVLQADYPTGRAGTAMHRAALHHILWHAMLDAGTRVAAGQDITGHIQQDSLIHLRHSDGMTAGFDLVIDASGTGSVLSPLTARAVPFGAIWGNVAWPDDTDLRPDQLTQHYDRASRMAGVLPIGRLPGQQERLAAIFWSLPATQLAGWRDQSRAEFTKWRNDVAAFWPQIAPFLAGLSGPEDVTPARYFHGHLPQGGTGRLVCIGDAAHRASPQLGQGANMALLDAMSLSRALTNAPDIDTALAIHQRSRRSHIALYQRLSALLTPLYQSHSTVLPVLRDHILAPVTQLPGIRRMVSSLVSGNLIPPLRGQDLTAVYRSDPIGHPKEPT